ncbi:MAG: NAD(P)/FAD-dependent oxidoreductase [Vicinamibacterales bacterium]
MLADVLVVGAGPAGAVAAAILARAGARVVLIDRARFPRPKLCGDSINPGALAILRRLGLARGIEPRGMRMDGMLVSGPDVSVEARYPDGLHGITIARQELDAALVADAAEAGADLREEVVARSVIFGKADIGEADVVETADETRSDVVAGVVCSSRGAPREILRARVTIAADGRHSALAFSLGLAVHPASPRRWAVGAHVEGGMTRASVGEMHIRRGHYIGVAPLPGGVTNICLVRPSAGGDARLRRPEAALREVIAGDRQLRDRFAHATLVAPPMVLGPLAVDCVHTRPVPRGLLVAGDASGFVDPMTGDGLRFALRGGELAATAALRALDRGWSGVHAAVAQARRLEFLSKWRFNRALRALVGSPAGVRAAQAGIRLSPRLLRAIICRAGDCGLAATGGR